jgi:hypothetical protein
MPESIIPYQYNLNVPQMAGGCKSSMVSGNHILVAVVASYSLCEGDYSPDFSEEAPARGPARSPTNPVFFVALIQ